MRQIGHAKSKSDAAFDRIRPLIHVAQLWSAVAFWYWPGLPFIAQRSSNPQEQPHRPVALLTGVHDALEGVCSYIFEHARSAVIVGGHRCQGA